MLLKQFEISFINVVYFDSGLALPLNASNLLQVILCRLRNRSRQEKGCFSTPARMTFWKDYVKDRHRALARPCRGSPQAHS